MADEQKLVPWQLVHENERLRDEVAILRLSQEECAAIRDAMQGYSAWMLDHVSLDRDDIQAVLYRLNGILERHAPPEVK